MLTPENPYRVGEPVGYTDDFIGRQDIVARVKVVLDDSETNVMLLYGQRRVGKTSVLQFLEKELEEASDYFPVFFELHSKSDFTLAKILRELAFTIALELKLDRSDLPKLHWQTEKTFREDWLREVLARLPERGSLVLLLDELDVLADPTSRSSMDSEQLSAGDLFQYLRHLSQEYARRLQFVFVIGRHKEDLSIIAQSLFRESPQCLVSLLYENDIIELVRLSEKNNTLSWSQSAIGQVIQLTNGHPLLTQQLCYRVWESAYEQGPQESPAVTSEDVTAVIPQVLQVAGRDFRWLWESLSPVERIATAVLAEAGSEPVGIQKLVNLLVNRSQIGFAIREVREALRRLQDRDVLEVLNPDSFKFRVELMRRWITQNRPPHIVQREVNETQKLVDNLYHAALELYKKGELEQAVDLARRAHKANRYHIEANQLLADILVDQDEVSEAIELLEWLYDHQPSAAERLIDAYLQQVKEAKGDDERLALYSRILEINPSHQETLEKWKETWELKARYFEQLAKSRDRLGNLEAACEAYRNADLVEKANKIEQQIQQLVVANGRQELEELERAELYLEALARLDELEQRFPLSLWDEYRARLTTKAELASRYQDALEALGRGDMTRAQDLLVHIVVSDPHYKDVTLHLHRVVTGSDLEDDLQSLGDRQREYEQAKLETRQARSEVKRVKSNLVRMKTEVEKARREIERLAAELNRSEARIQKQVDRRLRQESAIKQQQSQIADLEKKLQEQKEQAKEELEEIRADFHAEKLKTEADHNQRIQAVHREKEELVRKIGECHIARDRFRSERDAARQLNLERDRRIREVEEKARNCIVASVIVSILFLLSLGYLLLR